MQYDISASALEQLVKGISIPPQPTAMIQISAEKRKEEPDLKKIIEIISSDVSLSAGTLKTINSPLFGLRNKVTSIATALNILGLKNIFNIVSCMCLRMAFKSLRPDFMTKFWDRSHQVAAICAALTRMIPNVGIKSDEAYTLGLFHNCGVPLMMQKFPKYVDVELLGRQVLQNETALSHEEKLYGTTHCVVGYFMARSWMISEEICNGILHHHDLENSPMYDNKTKVMVALLRLAIHYSDSYQRFAETFEWKSAKSDLLAYLGLTESEYEEYRADIKEMLNEGI